MMKIKSIIALAFLMICSNFINAQIATRIPDSTKYAFGTRPKKGDKGLILAFTLKDSSMKKFNLNSILGLSDKVVYKKYCTDVDVYRLGLSLMGGAASTTGRLADSSYFNPVVTPRITNSKNKIYAQEMVFKPGFERHVKSHNVFDIYAGADALLGMGRAGKITKLDYDNGNYQEIEARMTYAILGADAFTGVAVFMAKLPLSIGLEYHWTCLTVMGGKVNIKRQEQLGVGATAEPHAAEYMVQEKDIYGATDNNLYGKLNKYENQFGLNNQIKLTATFFFN